jgi:uncharacterized protein YndB with AHSA1/START domain
MADDVSVSREIAASPEAVWAMVSDVTRMGEWSPENTGGTWIGGATGPTPGARFKGRNRAGVRRWSTVCTITDATPGEDFVFEVAAGPLKVARWAYHFVPTETGCTVTETWTDQRGGLIRTLAGPLTGVSDRASHNRSTMEATLERLAAAAEGAATG